jgi:mannose-6-phosphate isomerase-like protein (cupin superfamily)
MHAPSNLPAFKRDPSSQDSRWQMGSTLTTYLVDSRDTNGAYCLLEAVVRPGSEPPPHLHAREDELFYLLEGDIDVFAGDDVFTVGTGGCVFLPRLVPHAFIIRSPLLRMLALFTPGGIEDTFRRISAPATTIGTPKATLNHPSAGTADVVQILNDCGVRFLGPDEVAHQLPAYLQADRR